MTATNMCSNFGGFRPCPPKDMTSSWRFQENLPRIRLDLEMVANDEENGCRFEDQGEKHGYTRDLWFKKRLQEYDSDYSIHQHAMTLDVFTLM